MLKRSIRIPSEFPLRNPRMDHHLSTDTRNHVHYDHKDEVSHMRWTSRESYEFMHVRPWHKVVEFHSHAVAGRLSLSCLLNKEFLSVANNPGEESDDGSEFMGLDDKHRTGRWSRKTYKIVVSYFGPSFDGWQRQLGLNTIQGSIESALGSFVDDKKASQLQERSLPVAACVLVAGRTDKGVTAFQQVCSFYTWRTDVKLEDIEIAINCVAPGLLRVVSISEVSRMFHPNFSAKWRRYVYIFPLNHGELNETETPNATARLQEDSLIYRWQNELEGKVSENLTMEPLKDLYGGEKPKVFSVERVNCMLQQLECKSLSYQMFARDTKASRSTGPPTECFIFHARAAEAIVPSVNKGETEGAKAVCVELVANRFLRKMVRVLVATAIREAAAGAPDDALVKLMGSTCRRATAPPAPPEGLCLVDVGYNDFRTEFAYIL